MTFAASLTDVRFRSETRGWGDSDHFTDWIILLNVEAVCRSRLQAGKLYHPHARLAARK